jgi:hypothetical protein
VVVLGGRAAEIVVFQLPFQPSPKENSIAAAEPAPIAMAIPMTTRVRSSAAAFGFICSPPELDVL